MLTNSGYGLAQTRKILVNGIKCYEKKLRESRKTGGRQSERQSRSKRIWKKMTGKANWFKQSNQSNHDDSLGDEPEEQQDNKYDQERQGAGQAHWWRVSTEVWWRSRRC
jgi:hypothetical protein